MIIKVMVMIMAIVKMKTRKMIRRSSSLRQRSKKHEIRYLLSTVLLGDTRSSAMPNIACHSSFIVILGD